MSAATILAEAYGESANLYTNVLEISKEATPSQLRKAYYKKCLKYHPDKLSPSLTKDEKALAKKKFAAISLAYTILSDETKRREYDESGDLMEEEEDWMSGKEGMKQWTEYFNSIFPKVTTANITAFELKYKCSDEEQSDVLKYYTQFKGDLNQMLECVMLSSDVDKERWVKDYIRPAIGRGDVEDFTERLNKTLGCGEKKVKKTKGKAGKKKKTTMADKKKNEVKKKKEEEVQMMEEEDSESDSDYDSDVPCAEIVNSDDDDDELEDMEEEEEEEEEEPKENKKSNKSKKQSNNNKTSPKKKVSTKKASKPSKKKAASSDEDLIAAIRGKSLARREGGFDSLMAGLEDRYGGGKKKKKKQNKNDDIDDEEFAKIQAKLMKNKKNKSR